MTAYTALHATFVVTRVYAASASRVFKAFADPRAKAQWFVGLEDWSSSDHKLDFRVGGTESVSGGPPGGEVHKYNARIWDIVPDRRIVSSYDMHLDDKRISVSLATVELRPEGNSTRLVYTEQGVFLDGFDRPALREEGMNGILDQLGAALARDGV